MLIAIDGTAASGKGTLARLLSARLGLGHIDSGKIYRLVGLRAAEQALSPEEGEKLAAIALEICPDQLDRRDLSGQQAGAMASRYAKNAMLRHAITTMLRSCASKSSNMVVDGRDIGTEVFPMADVKIFVDADPRVRAERRVRELTASGIAASLKEILAELVERDAQDRGRAASPLRVAPDAIVLDTTNLDAEGAVAAALAIVERKMRKNDPRDHESCA
jgi:cytidylate kinase